MEEEFSDYQVQFQHEVLYIESMLTITRTAIVEQTLLQRTLNNYFEDESVDINIVIDFAQNIIHHAAALSRYFWPIRNKPLHQNRGCLLRKALDIQEPNALQIKKLRDMIEHFDERLDKYLTEFTAGSICPSYIGTRNDNSQGVNHFFRAFYTDDLVFQVLDVEYEIKPIVEEILRIHLLLEEFVEDGRLPHCE